MSINGLQIQQWLEQFFYGVHIDEHTALILLVGAVLGIFFVGGGYHRRAYGHYRRWRDRYY